MRKVLGNWQRIALLLLSLIAGLTSVTAAFAQAGARLDARSNSDDALKDAMLATPNAATPAPLSIFTRPRAIWRSRSPCPIRANVLLPLAWNSNADELSHGGTSSGEASPFANLSWATPVGTLPLRATLSAFGESDGYFQTPEMDLDKAGLSARLQYVNPANDQAFSPYFTFAPRWDFAPTFGSQLSARQDFDLGFNKRFNFDGDFQQLPFAPDTSASTVWSIGLTAFVQRRLREPQVSSDAVFFIPSASYVISSSWNASLALEFIGRWFDENNLGVATID